MVLNIFISECRTEHCEACFSRNYCTRCKSPYIAYRGRCIERCPGGLYYANYSKDCQERGLLNLVSLCNVTLNIFYTRYTMKFSSQYHIPNKIKSILYLDDNYEPSARHTAYIVVNNRIPWHNNSFHIQIGSNLHKQREVFKKRQLIV